MTRWSRIYVFQVGGDLHAGSVSLAGHDGGVVTVRLPSDFRYRKAPPGQLADVLAAIKGDYPDASVTAALAEALAIVLDVAARARLRARTVPVEAIEEAVTVPLRPLLDSWTTTVP